MKGIHVQLLCVGKMKEKFYIDAAAEYVKRLGAYCRLQVVELPEERLPANPSRAQIDAALEKEGAAIRARLAPGAALVALCVEGEEKSSEALSRLLAGWSAAGPGPAAPVHVSHDLPPPPGPGDAAGAALSGLQDRRGLQLPQVRPGIFPDPSKDRVAIAGYL